MSDLLERAFGPDPRPSSLSTSDYINFGLVFGESVIQDSPAFVRIEFGYLRKAIDPKAYVDVGTFEQELLEERHYVDAGTRRKFLLGSIGILCCLPKKDENAIGLVKGVTQAMKQQYQPKEIYPGVAKAVRDFSRKRPNYRRPSFYSELGKSVFSQPPSIMEPYRRAMNRIKTELEGEK